MDINFSKWCAPLLLLALLGAPIEANASDKPGPSIDEDAIYQQWRLYPERTEGFRATLTRQHITYFIGEGDHRRELEPPDFYRALGEHDLASRSRAASISRVLAVGLATSAVMGGILYFSPPEDRDNPHSLSDAIYGGAVFFPIGTIIGSLFFLRERHPADVNQRHQMMEHYNRSLSSELGVER